ncbi:MAG TPA: polyprenyl synthetase family protein [Gemmatimonadales bacterium]|nr:polyprenyl synthetase family protein [Gemmatimonadales bacterium]
MISAPDRDSAGDLLEEVRRRVDERLADWAGRLAARRRGAEGDAMAYAIASPGKRVRAALVRASYLACGGGSDAIDEVAAAVEIVHAYSLVHDDLPCMDNDDLRRGRPTTHRAFSVEVATRAGFLMVPVAAEVLAHAAELLRLDANRLGRMAEVLFAASGVEGMVGGQWLDLEAEQQALGLDALVAVHRGKTGALIQASCELGALAAGASDTMVRRIAAFGADIGLAFQVADDVLDSTASSEVLGKTAGLDRLLQKSTYVSVLGVDGARSEARRLAERAIAGLAGAQCAAPALSALARYIVERPF